MLDLSARAGVYRSLASLLQAGLLPDRALEAAATTAPRRVGASPLLASAAKVRAGTPLADALEMGRVRVPPPERAALVAAEQAGNLPQVLIRLADKLEDRFHALRDLLARAAYPLLVLHLAALAASVPAAVRGTGSFLLTWLLLTVALDALLLGLVALVRWRLRSSTSPDRWPVLGRLFVLEHQTEYLETFGLLYGSGVRLLESHRLASASVSRPPVRRALEDAARALEQGQGLASTLSRSGVMDPAILAMLATGEATGDLEGTAQRAARLLREEQHQRQRRTAGLAGTLLYALACIAVAVVVFRFYLGRLTPLR